MSRTSRHEEFLLLMGGLLSRSLGDDAFCSEFTALWMRDRDETYAKKATWQQPYDELLIAAFQRGEMSGEDFRNEYAKLWGYADDVEFQTIIDALHSACSMFSPSPELRGEIGEEELRQAVREALTAHQRSNKPLARTA